MKKLLTKCACGEHGSRLTVHEKDEGFHVACWSCGRESELYPKASTAINAWNATRKEMDNHE